MVLVQKIKSFSIYCLMQNGSLKRVPKSSKNNKKKLDLNLKLEITLIIIALKHAQNLRFSKGVRPWLLSKN